MAIICVALLAIKRKGIMPYVRQVLIVILLFAINLRPMYISDEIKVIRQKLNCYCIIVLDDTLSMMAEDYDGEDGKNTRMDAAKADIEYITKNLVGAKFCIIDFNNDFFEFSARYLPEGCRKVYLDKNEQFNKEVSIKQKHFLQEEALILTKFRYLSMMVREQTLKIF